MVLLQVHGGEGHRRMDVRDFAGQTMNPCELAKTTQTGDGGPVCQEPVALSGACCLDSCPATQLWSAPLIQWP